MPVLRRWFQGSQDGQNWTTLREHQDDKALKGKGGTATWCVSQLAMITVWVTWAVHVP